MDITFKEIPEIKLIGLDLGRTTSNKNGQSNIDGGKLWQRFHKGNYGEIIPKKTGDEIYAVYYGYEGDQTAPFRYFIGCSVMENSDVPEGLDQLTIPGGKFQKVTALGKMPDCMIDTWKKIWSSDIHRAYEFDFEVYGERSNDWQNAEIDIYLS